MREDIAGSWQKIEDDDDHEDEMKLFVRKQRETADFIARVGPLKATIVVVLSIVLE